MYVHTRVLSWTAPNFYSTALCSPASQENTELGLPFFSEKSQVGVHVVSVSCLENPEERFLCSHRSVLGICPHLAGPEMMMIMMMIN